MHLLLSLQQKLVCEKKKAFCYESCDQEVFASTVSMSRLFSKWWVLVAPSKAPPSRRLPDGIITGSVARGQQRWLPKFGSNQTRILCNSASLDIKVNQFREHPKNGTFGAQIWYLVLYCFWLVAQKIELDWILLGNSKSPKIIFSGIPKMALLWPKFGIQLDQTVQTRITGKVFPQCNGYKCVLMLAPSTSLCSTALKLDD